jgi:hypothetical protein
MGSEMQNPVLKTMAGFLCEDHLGDAVDLQTAIDALVAEIPSTEQAQKFRAMVLEKLG